MYIVAHCRKVIRVLLAAFFWMNAGPHPGNLGLAFAQTPDLNVSEHANETITGLGNRFNLLDRLATEETESGGFLGRPRFSISQTTISYDSGQTPLNEVLPAKDPLAAPLEILIRIKSLRRDFSRAVPSEAFWTDPLNDAERAVKEMLVFIQAPQKEWLEKERPYIDRANADFRKLDQAVLAFARNRRLDIATPREPARGYDVEVRIIPPTSKIRFMTHLAYKKCLQLQVSTQSDAEARRTSEERVTACLDDQWTDLTEGKYVLIGRYRYITPWLDKSGKPEQSDFEITGNRTVITFSPGTP
jgi:hypothetical protein